MTTEQKVKEICVAFATHYSNRTRTNPTQEFDAWLKIPAAKSLLESLNNDWVRVEDRLPEEGGRYWCYVEEVNDLGVAHYQWNISYHEIEKRFYTANGDQVTHWMKLPDMPLPEPPKS